MATAEQTTQRVRRILAGTMKLPLQRLGDSLVLRFENMSTQVLVRVHERATRDGEPTSTVEITAPVLRNLDPSPELFEYIARGGPKSTFGHLVVMDEQDRPGKLFLFLAHHLLGDYLDQDELSTAVFTVLYLADDLDDELQRRFGGDRPADLWTDR